MYKIYKHTMPDGKCYIGQTKAEKIYDRWKYGSGYRNQTRFYNDIVEIGWKNIKHEILEEVATKSEAIERERYYILKYRSNEPEYGYNKHTNFSSQSKVRKYVRCVETGEVYESGAAAGVAIGRTTAAISYSILHNKTCKGCHWERIELTEEEYWKLKEGQKDGE